MAKQTLIEKIKEIKAQLEQNKRTLDAILESMEDKKSKPHSKVGTEKIIDNPSDGINATTPPEHSPIVHNIINNLASDSAS